MIDDSDVFSIVFDSADPHLVFVSACSGIYRSKTGGEMFQKVPGIPFSARRTRVLKQDFANHRVIYAGTTEGLWRSTDAGTSWKQVGNSQIVVNDVLVDPRSSRRVLIATDRGGVMASADGGETFVSSNRGVQFLRAQITGEVGAPARRPAIQCGGRALCKDASLQ